MDEATTMTASAAEIKKAMGTLRLGEWADDDKPSVFFPFE